VGFPPAPWRLHGELIVVPARWGGVMLANYTGGTLAYHELIVFRPGFVVAHIYVDSPESMRGGREIWKLPKQLAEFTYSRSFVEVRQDGRTLFTARIRRRPGLVPLIIPGPAIGEGGKLSVGRITMRAAPALVEAHGFGIDGRRLALAGDGMRLYMP
jgi:acetoacetate decarboxylase